MRKTLALAGTLALLGGVAAAQDAEEPAVEVRVQVDGESTTRELRERLAGLVERMLATDDPAERDALAREMAGLVLGPTVAGRITDRDGRPVPGAVTTVRMLPHRGGETIKGSWADGERRGSWELSRADGDRYRLRAKSATTDGTGEQDITDEGSLAELTRRHAFLEGTAVVGFFDLEEFRPRPRSRTDAPDVARGTVPLPGLGLELAEAGDDLRHQFWLPVGVGWVVRSVTPDSPAARSGLQAYDLVTKVGDAWLERPEALRSADARAVPLTVLRRGHEIRLDLAQPE